jgi:metal-responsive CopG/Arc/MetJ family transcriptional regulator
MMELPRIKGQPEKYRVDVRLSKDVFDRLEERRKAEGYETLSELLRELIRGHLSSK